MRHYAVLGFVLLLTACQAFQNPADLLTLSSSDDTSAIMGDSGTSIAAVAQASTEEPVAPATTFTPTPTAQALPYEECFWNWSTRELPDVTQQIQAELAALTHISIRAYDYGEDCIGRASNTVQYFARLETDFDLTIQVNDPLDEDALTRDLVTTLIILKDHWDGDRGRVGIVLVSSSGTTQYYIDLKTLVSHLDQHPDGAGLLALIGIVTP